jgi:hypothetical protein
MRILACLTMALFAFAAPAQTPIDACDPPAAIQALSPDRTAKIAKIRETLAQSPDDLFLNRWLIELQPQPQTGNLAAEFRERLAQHPDDPRYAYLYARALVGKDTPSAIRSFQNLITQEPKLPWTYLALTEIYSSAAFRNPAKVAANLRAYGQACPANLEAFAHLNVVEDQGALRELPASCARAFKPPPTRGNCATTPRSGPPSFASRRPPNWSAPRRR